MRFLLLFFEKQKMRKLKTRKQPNAALDTKPGQRELDPTRVGLSTAINELCRISLMPPSLSLYSAISERIRNSTAIFPLPFALF